MRSLIVIIVGFFQLFHFVNAQSELRFASLEAVFKYADDNSTVIKNGDEQLLLADWQKKSAKAGIVNFKFQSSFSLIDNIKQPVTFLPAEIFGGTPGTFKEVTTGQPYIGNLTLTPQIDLINPGNWTKLKTAKINESLTVNDNLIAKKNLRESLSAVYYNILSLQKQIEITGQNLQSADTLLNIVNHKFVQGLVRKQDLNDVKINELNLKGTLEELQLLLKQQYLGLKMLCDIPESETIIIDEKLDFAKDFSSGLKTENQLEYKSALLKFEMVNSELKTNNIGHLPIISLVGSSSWQQNSKESFFDSGSSWINSQYVGIKLSVPFPDVNRYILGQNLKISRQISFNNAEHIRLQNNLTNSQIDLDYEKAYSKLLVTKNISLLKEENYQMALHQYEMEIIATDKLLIAFNDLLISQLSYSSAFANLQFTNSKISINNSVK